MFTTLFILVLIIAAVIAVASKQPDEFSVTRSAAFNAAPSAIFPHVNNLHKWDAWSPWAKLDPNAKNSFEGPEEGVGAKMSWQGNGKVGEGSMQITESNALERIRFALEFLKPMKASNTALFTFTQQGNQTLVTWSMSGKNSLMGKVMMLFINCEKMVGGQFEQGLASLKAIVEGGR